MVLRHTAGRHAARALRNPIAPTPAYRRGLAAPASGTFAYEASETSGVRHASRDLAGPTSTVALVSRAGTRYQPLPGLAEGLEKFAFRNTHRRSALRLQREAELCGATLFSHHDRESVVLGAKFFRDDLPYFLEVLSEVASQTKYLDYEFKELVMDLIQRSQSDILKDPKRLAIASAHGLAFHRGLGEPIHPTSSTPLNRYLSHDAIGAYSTLAYRKPNIAIVGNGVDNKDLSKWVGEFFSDMRTEPAEGVPGMEMEQTKYYGGQERIAHAKANAMVIAFPGSSSFTGGFYKPEVSVLAALIGGQSTIKWSPGFSLLGKATAERPGLKGVATRSEIYSDAGLFYTVIEGSGTAVAQTASDLVGIMNDIADGKLNEDDFKKARSLAKFKELEHGQNIMAGLELTGNGLVQDGKPYQLDETAQKIGDVTMDQVKKAAKDALAFKACVSAVGDLWSLPYGEEIGLKV